MLVVLVVVNDFLDDWECFYSHFSFISTSYPSKHNFNYFWLFAYAFYHKDVLHSSIYKPRQHSSKGRNKDEVYSYRHTQAFPHISGCRYPRETGLPCPAQGLGCTAHKAALSDRRDSHCGDNMTTLTIFQMKNLTILLLEFS